MSENEEPTNLEDSGVTDQPPPDNISQLSDAADQRESLKEAATQSGSPNMGMIMDIPVTLSMELGRTRISIRELLSLNPGAVIELQRLASEPMEILINGTLIAHGEAVQVGDRYGVRLTSVVGMSERLQQVNG